MLLREMHLLAVVLVTAHAVRHTRDALHKAILTSVYNSELVHTSTHFPHSCCTSSFYHILNDNNNSCVKMTFDDLDLPPQVSLTVYNVDNNGASTLIHRHQVLNSSSHSLLCPSILTSSLNGSLQLILDSTDIPISRYFAGYKVRYWSAKDNCLFSNASHLNSGSNGESCRMISVISGGQLVHTSNTHLHLNADVVEFIWVVKLPDYIPPRDTDALVFGQILVNKFNGEVDIRRDVYSDAELIPTNWIHDGSSLNSSRTMYFTSSSGFYIRAVFKWTPLIENTSQLSILTGVYRQHVVDSKGWFFCQNSSWYIPQQHVCDFISHCPLEEDELEDICHSSFTDLKSDKEFLKWLIPVVGSFLLLAVTVFVVKVSTERKNHRRHNATGGTDDAINRLHSNHDIAASQRLLGPVSRASAFGVPVPAARVPSSSVCIPIAGSVGTSGSFGAGGRSEVAGSQVLRVPIASGRHGGDLSDLNRALPISIPTVRDNSSAPIFVRPLIHRENSMVPPSYEEVTAEHSCGESTDSIEEVPDRIMEYHPPSYEDASQGKTDLVSSWVTSRLQNA